MAQRKLNETDKEVKIVAELPGLDQNDVAIELSDGVLTISGEKKSETEDKQRFFSERYYGRFERRIPVDDVDQEKSPRRSRTVCSPSRCRNCRRLSGR